MSHEAQKAAQSLLHKAEEQGQSRKLEASEVLAFSLVSGIKATSVALAAGVLVTGGRLLIGENVSIWSILLTTGGVGVASLAIHLLGDMDTLIEGLRSFRSVETFMPPGSEPVATSSSPIVVRPYGGDPYVLSPGDERPALPDGRVQLGLNPETLAVVLREVLSQHDGQWSRSRLMAIRVGGRRITRTLYEQMTDALCKAGFLQERPTGGYSLPPTVEGFEDLRQFFPRLPGLPGPSWEGGRAGGKAGGREAGCPAAIPPDNGEVGSLSLAELRRQRWLECGCDARLYLAEVRHG